MGRSHKQAAVIPYRVHGRSLQIALVTTSGRKRWIIPKGSLEAGERGPDAAVRETEEEAGLVGELTVQPIGRYRYSKENDWYDVDVYVMRVTIVLDSWPEASVRRRRWMTVDEAVQRLHPELHAFVHETERIARSGRPPSIQTLRLPASRHPAP